LRFCSGRATVRRMHAPATDPRPEFDRLRFAKEILRSEADSVRVVADRLDEGFTQAVELLYHTRGRVCVSGVGKSADIGQKVVATLNSTGTRAYRLDATNALHGDLGTVHPDDAALLFSHGGESEELVRLLGPLRGLCGGLIAVTSKTDCTLARNSDAVIAYGPLTEACPMRLAPSSSTTVMLALGDALAFTLSELREFNPEDFARFHPAGSLGRKLARVDAYMRQGTDVRVAAANETIRTVFAQVRQIGRRTGAVMLVDEAGILCGIFTDSDLARLFEAREDAAFDRPIFDVMTCDPVTVGPAVRIGEAMEQMRDRKLSELPVVDNDGRPVGLLDITDLIGFDPTPVSGPLTRPSLRLVRPT
jgi:arabinose-5-phosphate isomerase